MKRFVHRTYRVEWVARTGPFDQYGRWMGPADFEQACPTREDAVAALAKVATYDECLLRWRTGKDYHGGEIVYREVLVAEKDEDG